MRTIPAFLVAFDDIVAGDTDACTVEKDLKLAEAQQCPGDHCVPRVLLGDIVVKIETAPADEIEGLAPSLIIDIRDADERTFLCHSYGALAPDPGASARDDRRLVAKSQRHSTVPPPSITSSAPSTRRDSSLARKTIR